MKIWPVSDIHLEFGSWKLPEFTDQYPDICILAGDIHPGQTGLEFAEHIADKYSIPVVYICGNHEYYGMFKHRSLLELNEILREKSETTNVHFLNNGIADFREKFDTVVIGCTLWTDFDLYQSREQSMRIAQHGMNDYRLIEHSAESSARITPEIILDEHKNSIQFLHQALGQHSNSKCVVVTHHAPTIKSLPDGFTEIRDAEVHPCYASDLTGLINRYTKQLKLWHHGHIHYSSDYMIADTRVVANPRGYIRIEENEQFVSNLIIEI